MQSKVPGFITLLKIQNILVLLAAQTLVAVHVFGHRQLWRLLWHEGFIFMLLATGSALAAGYIINHFYHQRRDRINRPYQTAWIEKIPLAHRLYIYFFLNFLTLVWAAFISWRAVLFFGVYIFLIWLYFHKIHHYPPFRELFVTFLIAYPFFGVMLFFKQWNAFVLWAGVLFILLLLLKETVKNHLTLRGDMAQNIRTLLTWKGEIFQKRILSAVVLLSYIPIYILWRLTPGRPYRYFLALLALMLAFIPPAYYRGKYGFIYQWIKLIILSGVFALFLL